MASQTSQFHKTVCLREWWLAKDGKDRCSAGKLLVGGSVAGGRERALREFLSAPIAKRHDLFTLETSDGIFIILNGPIDKQRTCDSGLPELLNHFVFGFPPDWEIFAEKCSEAEAATKSNSDQESAAGGAAEEAARLFTPLETATTCQNSERCEDAPNNSALESQGNLMSQSMQGKKFLSDNSQLQHCTEQAHLIKQTSHVENDLEKNSGNTPVLKVGCEGKQGNYLLNPRSSKCPGFAENVVNSDVNQANCDTADRILLNDTETSTNDSMVSITTPKLNIQSSLVAGPDDHNGSHLQGDTYDNCNLLGTSDCQVSKKSRIGDVRTHDNNTSGEGNLSFPGDTVKIPSLKDGHEENSCCPKSSEQNVRRSSIRTNGKSKRSSVLVGSAPKFSKSNAKNGSKTAASNKCSTANETSRKRKERSSAKVGAGTNSKNRHAESAKRKLEYDQQKTPMPNKKKKCPKVYSCTSPSAFKTSRSGRVLLPTLEFWRNQLPVYDMGGELSGIKEGSRLLKIERGKESLAKEV